MCEVRVLRVSDLPAGVVLWRSPATGVVYVDSNYYTEALAQLLEARPHGSQ